MWDQVLQAYRELHEKAEETYLTKAASELMTLSLLLLNSAGFNCTDEENDASLSTLRTRAWLALRGKITEQTADGAILTKLRARFEERFRYDEKGVPRVWKPEDDIDTTFTKARDAVSVSNHEVAVRS